MVAPATPQDNYSLLRAAIDCGDPVIYMEHKELWGLQAEVKEQATPLGKARVVREGKDLTLVTWSRTMHAALEAAEKAKRSVEVIDLRTLWPWDRETVFASCKKTRKLLVVHEAVQAGGIRRGDRRDGGRGTAGAGEAARRAADSGGLLEAAGG